VFDSLPIENGIAVRIFIHVFGIFFSFLIGFFICFCQSSQSKETIRTIIQTEKFIQELEQERINKENA